MKKKKLKNGLKVTAKDGVKYYTYPKFRWLIEWLEYSETLSRDERHGFNWAVILYGLYVTEPTGLHGEDLEYFNANIRPELDRQHKRLKEGKEI